MNDKIVLHWFCITVVAPDMRAVLAIYLAGVAVGLWRTDGSAATKAAVALLWPLGPVAFLVTISGLLVALVITFAGPKPGPRST